MDSGSPNRWLERREPDGPATRAGQPPARRGAASWHRPSELPYQPNGGRESAWAELGTNAQQELRSRVGGEIIDWWAGRASDGKLFAVVLGPTGLCKAEPATTPQGKRAYRMKRVRFVPDSLAEVTWRQTEASKPTEGTSEPGENTVLPLARYLGADYSGFLGNLPEKAQAMIEEPFTPRPDLTWSYHYELNSDLAATTWLFWCYLIDDQVLTFCCGAKVTQRAASPGPAKWKVTCYRAAIA